jgi:dienelactone hydrolase
LDSDKPLLIDQPEDNPDNRFIFEKVVNSIRKIKPRRQLFFVTHNPKIPVLADWITVRTNEDGSPVAQSNGDRTTGPTERLMQVRKSSVLVDSCASAEYLDHTGLCITGTEVDKMRFHWLIQTAVLVMAVSPPAFSADSSATLARRKQYLEEIRRILPHSSSRISGRISTFDKNWEDWVERTGELPPDFESMPSVPGLPDPLLLHEDGKLVSITTPEQWQRQRGWIRAQFEQWVYGKMPPAPDNLQAAVTATRGGEGQVTLREVRLDFGPDRKATLHLQLCLPEGKGPFPVYLTNQPPNKSWIDPAVRRGYIACFYQSTDPKYGRPDDSDRYIEVYPNYDFACLARWAWAGMRAVDYLYSLPEVDKQKIGITGHSRNGKQALVAAAFDERIAAVIPSSGNTGECNPWRYTTDPFANETIEQITGTFPQWFHPRLRFFAGREQKLPVDQNMLLALVAPRGLMMYSAYAETEGGPVGFEQAYRSALRVYRLLGHEEKLWLHLRAGEHGTSAADIENFLDFFDTVFGRKNCPKTETWTHGHTFENWRKLSGEQIDPQKYPQRQAGDFVVGSATQWDEKRATLRQDLCWALGAEPPGPKIAGPKRLSELATKTDEPLARLFRRPVNGRNMGFAILPFGNGLTADLYYPLGSDGKPKAGPWPLVVWLHEYAYQRGYSRYADASLQSLTQQGCAVAAFDQLGFGTRVLDAKDFYEKHPKWSLMGKMVADTRAAIDAAASLEEIDPNHIYLIGYSLGAKVGLLTAALDGRVKALAAVCGFDALRLGSPQNGTEGLWHYSHLHGLMPRLGFFIGQESRLPFDFHEALALIAPRPVLVVAPELDRYAVVSDVRREVEGARTIYRILGREDALKLDTPLDFNRFKAERQKQVVDWIVQRP